MQFSTKIQEQLNDKNISEGQILDQLNQFKNGIKPIALKRACILNDGIIKLNDDEVVELVAKFEKAAQTQKIIKFVPASGAATRMFKHLFEYKSQPNNPLITDFFNHLEEFPFYSLLENELPELKHLLIKKDYQPIINTILQKLNYGFLPKGSILFHQYDDEIRTAFEEHLYEGENYSIGKNEQINIHFTVAKNHQKSIIKLLKNKIHKSFLHQNILLNFSCQNSNTDTITVDLNNDFVKNQEDKLVFRPGGHGALIYNLNSIDADLIFIKNIDNIVPDSKREDTIVYKKALGGLALGMANKRTQILSSLDQGKKIDPTNLTHFLSSFGIEERDYSDKEIYTLLDRPIRVCGMVKNQNEPGGGPFWVKDDEGVVSKQIVEKSQVNFKDASQEKIFQQSSHFNPVDLVCITKNHLKEPYDLLHYVDDGTGFISEKSLEGKTIKALELPGLWNGAMAKWNTLFVEVPLSTFNPVKTVNDLIRPIRVSLIKK